MTRPLTAATTAKGAHTKVIVGMSGGVDSSVAALRLQQAGFAVEGLFMKNWEEDDGTEYCTAEADLEDAQQVADALGIRLHRANFAAEYWDDVFAHFLAEYKAGRTPNPDIACNREIKFKAFLEYAISLGADCIATGHYARVEHAGERTRLRKGLDPDKDQSYFLHTVEGASLSRALMPLGDLAKPEVRAIAQQAGFHNHAKKDSTGICFIGERRFSDFLRTYLPAQPGPIEDEFGTAVGRHQGLMYVTLGQRQGLGIGGRKGRAEAPWYVVAKDLARNVVTVAQGNDHPALLTQGMRVRTIHWIGGVPTLPFRGAAKARYRQPDQACTLEACEGGFEIHFDKPQRAVTPGQSVCFYDDDICLGGGVIEESF